MGRLNLLFITLLFCYFLLYFLFVNVCLLFCFCFCFLVYFDIIILSGMCVYMLCEFIIM